MNESGETNTDATLKYIIGDMILNQSTKQKLPR